MSKVTVYRFQRYDIVSDQTIRSRCWATREAIERVRGEVLEDTATEVDASVIGSEVPSMTERDFASHKLTDSSSECPGMAGSGSCSSGPRCRMGVTVSRGRGM